MYDANPRRPPPPEDVEQARNRGSLLPVIVTLAFVAGVVTVIVGFTGVAGLLVLVALAGVAGFVLLHYVLWGWWLTKHLREQEEQQKGDDAGP